MGALHAGSSGVAKKPAAPRSASRREEQGVCAGWRRSEAAPVAANTMARARDGHRGEEERDGHRGEEERDDRDIAVVPLEL